MSGAAVAGYDQIHFTLLVASAAPGMLFLLEFQCSRPRSQTIEGPCVFMACLHPEVLRSLPVLRES